MKNATGAVMGDIGTMMQTASGRELLNKMTNNVNVLTGEHHKTNVVNDPHRTEGRGLDDGQAMAHNGFGEDAMASYASGTPDGARQLFGALTQSMHITDGTEQTGFLGDDYGTYFDSDGHQHARIDQGAVPKADYGKVRERAAVEGSDGYGTTLHGEKITLSQYDKEQQANRARLKAQFQQKYKR
jgi:hypothetical protein